MNRILMAVAVVLVSGAPLALAANGVTTGTSLATRHCSYIDQQGRFKSDSATQVTEKKVDSLCQQDRHKESNTAGRGGSAKG